MYTKKQWPFINYAGTPQKYVRKSVLNKEGCEEIFPNPFTAITINNKQAPTGATAAVILLPGAVLSSAGAGGEMAVGGVAKQRHTAWRPTPLPGRRRWWLGPGCRSTAALRALKRVWGHTNEAGAEQRVTGRIRNITGPGEFESKPDLDVRGLDLTWVCTDQRENRRKDDKKEDIL